MSDTETLNVFEFFKRFPNEEAARLHFEEMRWHGHATCPHCGTGDVVECKDHKPMAYRCRKCRKHFSVRTGTVLAESKVPLRKWLMAIYLLTTSRKGISSIQLAKTLGVTQKTAWFLAHRIREAWTGRQGFLGPDVEMDETYLGGKERNKHNSKKLRAGRGAVGKEAVIGLRERAGRVQGHHVARTDRKTIRALVAANVADGATLYTDEFGAYRGIGSRHHTVNHSIGEYVRGSIHTNSIESFWALLKRGHYGIYHHMSPKHLQRYVDEFATRCNLSGTSFDGIMSHTVMAMVGRRLTYGALIHGA